MKITALVPLQKHQALKYRSEVRLTKCSMTWSLGQTYMYCAEINISTIWKSHLNLGNEFLNPTVKTPHLITHLQFTFYTSVISHYSDSPFASSSGLVLDQCIFYILIYVGQSYSWVGHQFTRVGQTINLSFTWAWIPYGRKDWVTIFLISRNTTV
jgi:hypothetical protein